MLELKGKFNEAKVFTDVIESEAISQIIYLLNQEFLGDCQIRIMPDVHPGADCTIGTTMTIHNKIVPNLVSADIGCGMETTILKETNVDLPKLDEVIRAIVPAGFTIRKQAHKAVKETNLSALRCGRFIRMEEARRAFATLGGGNHFIELDQDDAGRLYLVIHSGSRALGKGVARFYQNSARRSLEERAQKGDLSVRKVPRNLAFVEGALFDDYMHDMAIVQRYAVLSRQTIAQDIAREMGWNIDDRFATIHNYVDTEHMVLRKGAISAKQGERVLIPINMRDGSLICVGRGNPDWNYSAPHGAGRLMSRSDAKQLISFEEYEESMKGIYSSSVKESTIDESPFAYKPMEDITSNIGDTVDIDQQIKPLYNFKASN